MWRFLSRKGHGKPRTAARFFRPRLETLEDRTAPSISGIGAFNPESALWALRSSATAGEADAGSFQFSGGQVPVVGDWNGDGRDDIGVFNRDTATWSLRYGLSAGAPDAGVFKFGKAGSIPVVGDWNGDGRDDIGVFDPKTATWSLRIGLSTGPANGGTFKFGTKDSTPIVGDWDGDGKDGIGVFNQGKGTWSLRQTATAGAADAGTFKLGGSGVLPVVGDWNGDGRDGIGTFNKKTFTWSLRQEASAGIADVGVFQFGDKHSIPLTGAFAEPVAADGSLITLNLKPLDLDLLGLKVQSSPITATISVNPGDGQLLGNALSTVAGIVDFDQINTALNNVLGATFDLLNSVDLHLAGLEPVSTVPAASVPVLELFVAPVHLDLLGVQVDTSPIRLTITAQSGQGLILGNILTELTNLFNPPLPERLDLAFINDRLTQLLASLRQQLPGIPAAESPPPVLGDGQFLALTVPAIDLDLLGLVLETQPITINATATEGDGALLGNLLTVVFNTLDATPAERSELNANINALLAQVVGVLNSATLTLPPNALDPLSNALKSLALPDLITAQPGAETSILDLVIASPDGTTPPVALDLLGLNVTTGNIDAQLTARTGEGQVLGNLLYNVANLLNPGGPAALISLISDLANGTSTTDLGNLVGGSTTTTNTATTILTLNLPALDIDLLGLEVQSSPITVTLSAQEGNGKLLGNVLTAVSTLLNTDAVSRAINNVLSTTVGLLNSVDLEVGGLATSTATPTSSTTVLSLDVAPVHLDLLGVLVDTGPIHLTITAQSGQGLILGNVLTALSDLLNPPLPGRLDLAFLNQRLTELLADLNTLLPTIPSAESPPPVLGEDQFLALTVPAIDLNLLGLMLETTPITVNAYAQEGNGELLGNLLSVLLNTLGATPEELTELNSNINALLAKVVGVLNAATLTLPTDILSTLSGVMQTLALPNLISTEPGATAKILDLVIASPDGTTPPVSVDLLGLLVTTSNINADLSAQTGEGLILGNLLYNVANLLNTGNASSLLYLLAQLGR